ncbi:MAG: AAA family ATPase [Chloroflexi bacterium]|nr:AAA family ATPase [Chloroflexota bacterium]
MARRRLGRRNLTGITVKGLKSIDYADIEVRPLTILAGANSSGKSSIMQPMLLMKQTLDATHDPGPLLLNGPHVRFTQYEQLRPRTLSEEQHLMTAGYRSGKKTSLSCEFKFPAKKAGAHRQIELSSMTVESTRDPKYTLTPDLTESEIIPRLPERMQERMNDPKQERLRGDTDTLGIESSRCFLHIVRYRKGERRRAYPFSFAFISPFYWTQIAIEELIHVPGLRGNKERAYHSVPAQGPRFPGTFENYIGGLILHWQEEGSEKIKLVGEHLRKLELTESIEAAIVDDVNVELKVARVLSATESKPEQDSVSIADVGFGVSQVLPVLVALVVAQPGQMVYIEQPELHLHPRAQVALAEVLAFAANRGVRVVIETHSALLLHGVKALIAEGKLESDKVMLHWFSRSEEGKTGISSGEFDDKGAYGKWPVDFADVQLGIQERYFEAVVKRAME